MAVKEFRNASKEYVLKRAASLQSRWPVDYFEGMFDRLDELSAEIKEMSGSRSGIYWISKSEQKMFVPDGVPINVRKGDCNWIIKVGQDGELVITSYHSETVSVKMIAEDGSVVIL